MNGWMDGSSELLSFAHSSELYSLPILLITEHDSWRSEPQRLYQTLPRPYALLLQAPRHPHSYLGGLREKGGTQYKITEKTTQAEHINGK